MKRLKRKTKSKSKSKSRQPEEAPGSSRKSPSTQRSERSQEKEAEPEEESPKRVKTVREPINDESLWKKGNEVEVKGRNEEFDDYLADLLL